MVIKSIRLRCAGVCCACGAAMPRGTEGLWDKTGKQVGHVACPDIEPITVAMVEPSVEDKPLDVGVVGASARQIADQQHAKRARAKQRIDDATRRAHPRIGNLLVKVRDIVAELEKPSSWRKGARVKKRSGGRSSGFPPRGS